MAIDPCTPCECQTNYIGSERSYRGAVLNTLCRILASEQAESLNIQGFLLCDDVGPLTIVEFVRFVVILPDFTEIIIDTELDMVTPYVVVGTVAACGPLGEISTQILCDDNAGVITQFVRYYLVIKDDFIGIDTELDGTTLYTPTGTVATCCCESIIVSEITPPEAVFMGQNTVAVAGTQEALAASQVLQRGVEIRALPTNTNYIYVGDSTVSNTTGLILRAGEAVFLSIGNLATVYIDSAVNGEGVSYIGS